MHVSMHGTISSFYIWLYARCKQFTSQVGTVNTRLEDGISLHWIHMKSPAYYIEVLDICILQVDMFAHLKLVPYIATDDCVHTSHGVTCILHTVVLDMQVDILTWCWILVNYMLNNSICISHEAMHVHIALCCWHTASWYRQFATFILTQITPHFSVW